MHLTPAIEQNRLPIRWTAPTALPPRDHVGKLETHHRQAPCGEQRSHPLHERTVHGRTCAVGEDQRRSRIACRPRPAQLPVSLTILWVLIRVNTGTLPFHH